MSKKNKYQNIADEECKQAVIFARVSSEEQKKGASIDAQLKTVIDYCNNHKFKILDKFSIVESSTRGGRLKFYEMLEFVKSQKHKCDEKMYNELKTEIEMEKEKLQKDMDKYLEIDAETDEILANIAEIAANVGKFLKSPIISEKRDILKLILSDCKTEGKNIAFSIVKPFNKLLKTPETDKWCAILCS